MVCRSCGANLPSDARFCHECGRAVEDAEPRPRAATTAAWLLIGSGALSLFGAGLLGFVLATGEVPPDQSGPLIIGILLLGSALGTAQLAAGVGVLRRLRWAYVLGIGIGLAALALAVVDVATVLFGGGGGTATTPIFRIVLNALAVRSLFESRSWFRPAATGFRPADRPTD